MKKILPLLSTLSLVSAGSPDEIMALLVTPMAKTSPEAATCDSTKALYKKAECCKDENTYKIARALTGEEFPTACAAAKPLYNVILHDTPADETWLPRLKETFHRIEARRNSILETATASGFNVTTECLGESDIFGKVPCMAHQLWTPDILSNELLWVVNNAPPTVYNMSWFSKGLVAQGLSMLGVLEFGMSELYKPPVVNSEVEIMQDMSASVNNWAMMVRNSHMHQIVFNGMKGLYNGIGYLMWDRPTLEVNYPTSVPTILTSLTTVASNDFKVAAAPSYNYTVTFSHPDYTAEDQAMVKIWAWVTTVNNANVSCTGRNGCADESCYACDIDYLDWTWDTKPSASRVVEVDGHPVFVFDLNVPEGFNFLLRWDKPGKSGQSKDFRTKYALNDELIQKNPYDLFDNVRDTPHAHVKLQSVFDMTTTATLKTALPSLEFVTGEMYDC